MGDPAGGRCGLEADSWFYISINLTPDQDSSTGGNGTGGNETSGHISPFIESLHRFSSTYQPVHGYLCVVLCAFGILTNVLNFLVLTRPNMRTSTNMILAAIALCDTGTMSTYMIYVVYFYVRTTHPCSFTYGWMYFILFHSLWSILLHSSSIWLVVLLALMRLAVMRRAKFSHAFLKPENVWKLMLYIYAPLGVLCTPVIFTHTVEQTRPDQCPSESMYEAGVSDALNSTLSANYSSPAGYTISLSQAGVSGNCFLLRVVLWINGLCFKLLPCMLLAISIWGLMRTLSSAKRRNTRVLKRRGNDSQKTKYFNSRTTKMLLAILIIFLITELPQALVATLSGLNPYDMYFTVYPKLGDLLDLLSLLNSGVNFVLYCAMSSRFRSTFLDMFLPHSLRVALKRRRRRYSISDNEANGSNVMGLCNGFATSAVLQSKNLTDHCAEVKIDVIKRRSSGMAAYGAMVIRDSLTEASATLSPYQRNYQSLSDKYSPVSPRRNTALTLLSFDNSSPGQLRLVNGFNYHQSSCPSIAPEKVVFE